MATWYLLASAFLFSCSCRLNCRRHWLWWEPSTICARMKAWRRNSSRNLRSSAMPCWMNTKYAVGCASSLASLARRLNSSWNRQPKRIVRPLKASLNERARQCCIRLHHSLLKLYACYLLILSHA
jgi:hypothetical protein